MTVVTGASSGIGRAIALELAACGADVLVHARANRAGAEETAEQARSSGVQARVELCDLADAAAGEALMEAAWNWQGRIDAWINNAGADVLTGAAARLSFEEKLARLWQVDVLGTIRLSRLIGSRMREHAAQLLSHGHFVPPASIVNIGWDQAGQGMAGESGEMFGAVKGAVMAFSRSLAMSLAPQVRVNCVAPGWIQTAWGQQASEGWRRRAIGESLLARWGQPEDIARAVRFLVSPEAEFINGQVIPVNGGFRRASE